MRKLLAESCMLVCIGTAGLAHAQPALPALLDTTYPTQTGSTRTVCASGCTHTTLQAAIDAAAPGDTISLAPGSEHSDVVLRGGKPNTGQWIVIRSSSAAFNAGGSLQPGTRVNGADAAHTSQMATIRTTNNYAISTAAGAHHYRIVGIDIAPAGATNVQSFVLLGSDATSTPAANDIVIDRCYIHGNPTGIHRRGVVLLGSRMAVIDSDIREIHDDSGDDNAVAGWNGPGPFKIANNRLESAGEVILFGGSDPRAEAMTPADIEVRGNVMTKPMAWGDGVEPDWDVKNIFELKNAKRVWLYNNLLEKIWLSGQAGYALVITVRNQDGACTYCTIEDVTIDNNVIRDAAAAVQLLGSDNVHPSGPTRRVLIRNNLFENIGHADFKNTQPKTILLLRGPSDITFEHNTFLNVSGSSQFIYFGDGFTTPGFVFRKNLMRKQFRGIFGTLAAEGTATLAAHAPGYVFVNNGFGGVSASSYPAGNQYPTLDASQSGAWQNQFVNYNNGSGGDYHLKSSNIYAAAGNGDVGANIDTINCAVFGVCIDDEILTDTFTGSGAPDPNKWTVGVFSGSTDASISVARASDRLQIGPLPNATGTHYNGVYSLPFNFSSAYAQVQVVQAAAGAETYTMLTIGFDASNYYRVTVHGGTLACRKEIGGVKTTLCSVPYDPVQHAYWRISHEGTQTVWTTSPSGSPGTWTEHSRETWNTGAVPLSTVRLELKAGTSLAVANAGSSLFDNFRAARP